MRNFHALTRAPQAFLAGPLPSQTCLSGPSFGQKLSQTPLPKSGSTYQLAGYGRGARDALHNSTRAGAARIGMGCKAHFAANSACYWQEMQRRRPPEAALAQAEGVMQSIPGVDRGLEMATRSKWGLRCFDLKRFGPP